MRSLHDNRCRDLSVEVRRALVERMAVGEQPFTALPGGGERSEGVMENRQGM